MQTRFLTTIIIGAATSVTCLFFVCADLAAGSADNIGVVKKKTSSGTNYLILEAHDQVDLDFAVARPSSKDPSMIACIPAAFSSHRGNISGFYAYKGGVHNIDTTDRAISGAIEINDGKYRIFDTNRGALINKELFDKLQKAKSSMFQQFQVVKNKQAEGFTDKSHYQRRCIALMNNGERAIIESDESITLTDFAKDLVELGVADAVYTDMGPWDEGWYKDPATGRKVTIGHSCLLTGKQTNWVVFKKR